MFGSCVLHFKQNINVIRKPWSSECKDGMVTSLSYPVRILKAYGIHKKAFTHKLAPHDADRGDLRKAFDQMVGFGSHENLPLFLVFGGNIDIDIANIKKKF